MIVVFVSCKPENTHVTFGIDTNGTRGRLDSTGVKSTNITLYTNSNWQVTTPDWVDVTPRSGTVESVEKLDTVQLYFKGLPNETGAIRMDLVQVVAPNGVNLSFNVWQNAQPAAE